MHACFYLTSQCVIARNPTIKQNMKYCIFITTFYKDVFSFSVETCFTSSRVLGKKVFITETLFTNFLQLCNKESGQEKRMLCSFSIYIL